MQKPNVTAFFDTATNTVSFVVKDEGTNRCAIIDSVLDSDHASVRKSPLCKIHSAKSLTKALNFSVMAASLINCFKMVMNSKLAD